MLGLVAAMGCASKLRAQRTTNPPPSEAYSAFGRIELLDVTGSASNDASPSRQFVTESLQRQLSDAMKLSLIEWNHRPDNGRTLAIAPAIQELEYVDVGARWVGGRMAGVSAIRLMLRCTEVATGRVIDEPEFFRTAHDSGVAVGTSDRMMIGSMASAVSRYIMRNFDRAVGGPTGASDRQVVQPTGKQSSAATPHLGSSERA
jgi:hypothetical protein